MRRSVALLAMALLAPAGAEAVRSDLGPEDVGEALAHGKTVYERLRDQREAIDDVERGYLADLGPEVGRALLYTEFSTVALEARRFAAIARDPRPEDVEQMLGPLRGRLKFVVILVGSSRDFLRTYTARLVQGATTASPARWDVYRSTPAPGTGRFQAPGEYVFHAKDVNLEAPVTLLLSDPQGREVRFDFDLSRLR